MLKTRKGPVTVFAGQRLACQGSAFLLPFGWGCSLVVHRELRGNNRGLSFKERSSGEENLWGVDMRGEEHVTPRHFSFGWSINRMHEGPTEESGMLRAQLALAGDQISHILAGLFVLTDRD